MRNFLIKNCDHIDKLNLAAWWETITQISRLNILTNFHRLLIADNHLNVIVGVQDRVLDIDFVLSSPLARMLFTSRQSL